MSHQPVQEDDEDEIVPFKGEGSKDVNKAYEALQKKMLEEAEVVIENLDYR